MVCCCLWLFTFPAGLFLPVVRLPPYALFFSLESYLITLLPLPLWFGRTWDGGNSNTHPWRRFSIKLLPWGAFVIGTLVLGGQVNTRLFISGEMSSNEVEGPTACDDLLWSRIRQHFMPALPVRTRGSLVRNEYHGKLSLASGER